MNTFLHVIAPIAVLFLFAAAYLWHAKRDRYGHLRPTVRPLPSSWTPPQEKP